MVPGYDENGWAVGVVEAWAPGACWTLLSPQLSSRIDAARLAHQARRFFSTELTLLSPEKHYPADGWPLADCATVRLSVGEVTTEVALLTLPPARAPQAMAAADRGVVAIGGAGFDVLVKRTQRVWQIAAEPVTGDGRGPLLMAAILASLLLAPVVPPTVDAIFGVKGARERLARRGLHV